MTVKIGAMLLVVLLVVAGVAKAATSNNVSMGAKTNAEHIKDFVQKSTRLYQTSLQDAHYVQALTHVNHAVSYMNAARKIATSDEEVQALTNVHPREWLATLDGHQASVIAKMQASCPNPFTKNPYMQHTGWSSVRAEPPRNQTK